MHNYNYLDHFEIRSLYKLLKLYDEREVEDEIHAVFDGSHVHLPNHWRDEQQFQKSYHTMHRLACVHDFDDFSKIASSGDLDLDELTSEEIDYFNESEVVEDECYYLFDFLTCLHFEKKAEDHFRHLGRG